MELRVMCPLTDQETPGWLMEERESSPTTARDGKFGQEEPEISESAQMAKYGLLVLEERAMATSRSTDGLEEMERTTLTAKRTAGNEFQAVLLGLLLVQERAMPMLPMLRRRSIIMRTIRDGRECQEELTMLV